MPSSNGSRPQTYIICATPRSGSGLLCDLLATCEAMGKPQEFLNIRSTITPLANRFDLFDGESTMDLRHYMEWLQEKFATPNGVFGGKVLFEQLPWALEFECTRELFRQSRLIWLSRRDNVSQAVSRYVARRTRQWSLRGHNAPGDNEPDSEVTYSESDIKGLMRNVAYQDSGWLEFFAVNGVDVLQVTYEQLLADANAVCHEICRYCGVSVDHEFALQDASLRRQASPIKEELREQYVADSTLSLAPRTDASRSRVLERGGLNLFEGAHERA